MSTSRQSPLDDLGDDAVLPAPAVEPGPEQAAASSTHRRQARIAIAIGGCTIVAACVVGLLSFQVSRQMAFRRVAKHNLTIARTVAYYLDEHPPVGDAAATKLALAEIRAFWDRFDLPASEAFLCVVSPAGEMVVCTSHRSMEGQSAFDLLLEDPSESGTRTVGDLLTSKQEFWGEYITLAGEHQLFGFAYSETLDHSVMVHFPTSAINREVVAATWPWSVGIVIIALLLTPLSLGLLHRSYCSAQRTAERVAYKLKLQGRIVDSMTEGISLVRPSDGVILYCNPPFERMFGYETGELLGRHVAVCNAPGEKSPEEVADEIIASLGETGLWTGEVHNIKKDGTHFWSHANVTTLEHPDHGRVWVAVLEDISDKKRAEERYYDLYDNAPDMFASVDAATGKIVNCNTTLAVATGYTKDELRALPHISSLYHPDSAETRKEVFASFIAGRAVRNVELQLMRQDDSTIDVSLNVSAIRDESGNVVLSRSIWRDITARKKAEEDLRQTQFAVEHCSNPIYRVQKDGRISYANEAACRSLGYSRNELLAMSVLQIDADFPEDAWPAHWKEMKREKRLTFEARHRRKDGRIFPVQITTSFLEYKSQEFIWAYVTDITERKRAETEVRHSERRFRTTFESAVIAMALDDQQGRLIETNAAFQKMFGYSARELEGMTFSELTHPEDIDRGWDLFKELVQGKRDSLHLDKRYHRNDGTLLWGSVNVSAIRNENGSFRHTVAMVEDITERKRAEEALRESEVKYRELFESAYDVICLVDGEGNIVDINRRGELLTGYSRAELCGMNLVRQLVVPEDQDLPRRLLERAAPGEEYMYEMRWRTKDGRTIHFEGASTFRFSPTGEFLSTRCTLRDITERKRVEAERERLMSAIEQARETIIITDADAIIQYVNPAFERTTGYSRVEAVGQNPNIVKSGRHDAGFYKEMWDTLRRGETWTGEMINKKKDGTLYPEEMTISPVSDAAGKTVHYVAVKRDITERKRAEEQARQLQADLAHMSRLSSMGEMATGLAHELNQPLTVITNYAQGCVRRLKSNAIGPEELTDILGRIATAAQRSSSIIRGLRNLVRKSSALRFKIDINDCLMEVADLANAEAAQHHAKARFELEPKLPLVMADRTQLQQVILNLVQNGCEATQALPVAQREVMVRTKQVGQELEIAVIDNGPGVPEEMGDRIFEPFFTTKQDGIGMGLAISRSIIEAHGGRLWATRNPEAGTTFHIALPTAEVGSHVEE